MAEIRQPKQAKLIVGLLAARTQWLDDARAMLEALYGSVDIAGEVIPFTFTDYYRSEMGPALLRQFLAFDRLITPDELAPIKKRTNQLEDELAERFTDAPRPVNIDPGYVELAKLVLASAKDFAHRIYLADGIYAEVTMQYHSGKWESLPWTFPDYGSGRYDAFLNAARLRLKEQTTRTGAE